MPPTIYIKGKLVAHKNSPKQEILDQGFLPLSLLASAALPTLIEPVEIKGKLLLDGGIANNFPIDEVKNMGLLRKSLSEPITFRPISYFSYTCTRTDS